MQKFYCDICREELKDKNFFSEILIRKITPVFSSKELHNQILEKHFNICKKCMQEKLPDFIK